MLITGCCGFIVGIGIGCNSRIIPNGPIRLQDSILLHCNSPCMDALTICNALYRSALDIIGSDQIALHPGYNINIIQVYPFPWQSVVEITTTVTNRHDELDEVVCDLLSSLTNCSLGNGLISQVG